MVFLHPEEADLFETGPQQSFDAFEVEKAVPDIFNMARPFVAPHFQRGGVGGIQLERHIHRFLQFLNHAREHGDFIHARIANVDVQNLRARVHLRNGDIDDVIQIARQ